MICARAFNGYSTRHGRSPPCERTREEKKLVGLLSKHAQSQPGSLTTAAPQATWANCNCRTLWQAFSFSRARESAAERVVRFSPQPPSSPTFGWRWVEPPLVWLPRRMACLPLLPPIPLPSQSNLSVFPPFTDGPQKRALQCLGVVSVGVEGGRCTFSSITFILWVPSIASSLPKIGLPFLSNTFALFPPCSSLARSSPFWLTASREILLREARGGRPSR